MTLARTSKKKVANNEFYEIKSEKWLEVTTKFNYTKIINEL